MRIVEDIHRFKAVLEAQSQFILTLPTRDWYAKNNSSDPTKSESSDDSAVHERITPWPEADALRAATTEVAELQVKIQSELRYVKREPAFAKLDARDFVTITKLLRNILLPIMGMESLVEVTDRIRKRGGWASVRQAKGGHTLTVSEFTSLEENEKEQWSWIFDQLRGPVQQLQLAMAEGLDYAMYTLELAKRPKHSAKRDVEAKGIDYSAGEKAIEMHLEKAIQDFLRQREGPLKEWCASKGMDHSSQKDRRRPSEYPLHQRHQAQLYLVLDVSFYCAIMISLLIDGSSSTRSLLLPEEFWTWSGLQIPEWTMGR